jgi:hypothetical protein
MKKLILLSTFILLSVVGLNAQNDFRKMNWGDSSNDLLEKYENISFTKEAEGDLIAYSHNDNIGGIDATVLYTFKNNKLFAAGYIFSSRSLKDSKERLKDFYSISQRLNNKYDMERDDQWFDNKAWKDLPDYLDHALYMGDVQLVERGEFNETLIMHTLWRSHSSLTSSLTHSVYYYSEELMDSFQEEIDDDF